MLETAKRIIPPNLEKLTAKYETLKVPTLLVWGRQDKLVPLSVGRRLHRALPDSRLVVIEESGHLPHEEKPAEVVSAMLSFLEETREDYRGADAASLGSSSRALRMHVRQPMRGWRSFTMTSAVFQACTVDLRDGGGGERLGLELVDSVSIGSAKSRSISRRANSPGRAQPAPVICAERRRKRGGQ
ncbi:MAG: hydrolase or acyltransferase, alpha/beta fold family [Microvirga sp.]|nr:hydrolase or acyltransferase, alpha/beta fold family [Microvirga sp.]